MERILVGYDGSEQSEHALVEACKMGKALNAKVTVLTAASDRLVRADGMVTMALDEAHGREVAERGAAKVRECGVFEVDVLTSLDAPEDALVNIAKSHDFTLVVVGHRSHSPLEELFLGSTAKQVVDRVECSVLVVR